MRKSKRGIFSKRVNQTRLGDWRYVTLVLSVLLLLLFVVASLFGILTYLAGFDEVPELLVEEKKFEVRRSELLGHDITEEAQSGLSVRGTFAVVHEVVISNEDEIDGEFLVTSTVTRGPQDSILSERATIPPGDLYLFRFEHENAWVDGEFKAEYTVTVPRIESVYFGHTTEKELIGKQVWTWPWSLDHLNTLLPDLVNWMRESLSELYEYIANLSFTDN